MLCRLASPRGGGSIKEARDLWCSRGLLNALSILKFLPSTYVVQSQARKKKAHQKSMSVSSTRASIV